MAKRAPVTVLQHNDRTLEFDLTSGDPAFTLAGKSLEFFVKRFSSDDDTEAVVKLTSADAAEIEVIDPVALTLKVKTRAVHNNIAGVKFYRLDIIEGAFRNTAMYGPYEVVDV